MELRRTFTTQAERYDRARPGYPSELFDEILAGLRPGDHVLEIGCGTGQATRDLVARGMRVTAVELGAEMATVAQRRVPDAHIVNAPFEEWRLPQEPFDLVVSATAFHWIDPSVRCSKPAAALRPGGSLAVFGSGHVAGGTTEFVHRVQECYERYMPGTPPGVRLVEPEAWHDDVADEMDRSGWFADVRSRRFVWQREYTTETYLDVIQTYSGHIALDEDNRRGLLGCIGAILDGEYGGRITKQYLTLLATGRAQKASAREHVL